MVQAINFIAGFAAAALAAMGVGGGGLLVVYLTMLLGTEQRAAQGINLVFFLCASLASMLIHFKKRRLELRRAALFALGGVFGAWLGCVLARSVSPEALRVCFGWMLTVTGVLTVYRLTLSPVLKKLKKARSDNATR